MKLTVLSIAYPLALVGPNQVGGAEQILSALDRALHEAGHTSLVIAAHGSEIAGIHIPLPAYPECIDDAAIRAAHAHCRICISEVLQNRAVDVIHMHGVDFYEYLPPAGEPLLATLHLPISWYPPHALNPVRPATWLNCVSRSQHASCPLTSCMVPPIPNGTALDTPAPAKKGDFGLVLGRICPEKGVHIALDAAKAAGIPLTLAGAVFPYREHRQYFETMVKPRLDGERRYIGPVGLEAKRKLLAEARCLLVTSLVAETSSLAAQEALAAGTPVVAFGKGALPETIDHGRTGYLVWDEDGLVAAIRKVDALDPQACRNVARERFSLDRMIERYFELYRRLAGESGRPAQDSAAA